MSFEKQVKPVLESACLSCHGEKKPKGNFNCTPTRGCWRGEYGKVVVPGKPEDSTLYTPTILPADADEVMPPKELLTKDQANVLKKWIAAGAKWPEGVVLKQVRRSISSRTS